jgi:hypothetical protein
VDVPFEDVEGEIVEAAKAPDGDRQKESNLDARPVEEK